MQLLIIIDLQDTVCKRMLPSKLMVWHDRHVLSDVKDLNSSILQCRILSLSYWLSLANIEFFFFVANNTRTFLFVDGMHYVSLCLVCQRKQEKPSCQQSIYCRVFQTKKSLQKGKRFLYLWSLSYQGKTHLSTHTSSTVDSNY